MVSIELTRQTLARIIEVDVDREALAYTRRRLADAGAVRPGRVKSVDVAGRIGCHHLQVAAAIEVADGDPAEHCGIAVLGNGAEDRVGEGGLSGPRRTYGGIGEGAVAEGCRMHRPARQLGAVRAQRVDKTARSAEDQVVLVVAQEVGHCRVAGSIGVELLGEARYG